MATRGHMLADWVQFIHCVVELGREWAATDTRSVGLGNAKHVVQHARADTGTGRRRTGNAVRRSDIRESAVIDVEQGSLRAFEKQIGAGLVGVIERARHVGHHARQAWCDGHGTV